MGRGSSHVPCCLCVHDFGVLRQDMSVSFISLSLRVKDIVLFKRFVALRNLACCCTASCYNLMAASHRERFSISISISVFN